MVIKKELRKTVVITTKFWHDIDPYTRLNGTHAYFNQREFILLNGFHLR